MNLLPTVNKLIVNSHRTAYNRLNDDIVVGGVEKRTQYTNSMFYFMAKFTILIEQQGFYHGTSAK